MKKTLICGVLAGLLVGSVMAGAEAGTAVVIDGKNKTAYSSSKIYGVEAYGENKRTLDDEVSYIKTLGSGTLSGDYYGIYASGLGSQVSCTSLSQIEINASNSAYGVYTYKGNIHLHDVGEIVVNGSYGRAVWLESNSPQQVGQYLTKGDANGDGGVTEADYVLMEEYIVGNPVSININKADMNGDGEITITDLSQLYTKLLNSQQNIVAFDNNKSGLIKAYANGYAGTAEGLVLEGGENYIGTYLGTDGNEVAGYELKGIDVQANYNAYGVFMRGSGLSDIAFRGSSSYVKVSSEEGKAIGFDIEDGHAACIIGLGSIEAIGNDNPINSHVSGVEINDSGDVVISFNASTSKDTVKAIGMGKGGSYGFNVHNDGNIYVSGIKSIVAGDIVNSISASYGINTEGGGLKEFSFVKGSGIKASSKSNTAYGIRSFVNLIGVYDLDGIVAQGYDAYGISFCSGNEKVGSTLTFGNTKGTISVVANGGFGYGIDLSFGTNYIGTYADSNKLITGHELRSVAVQATGESCGINSSGSNTIAFSGVNSYVRSISSDSNAYGIVAGEGTNIIGLGSVSVNSTGGSSYDDAVGILSSYKADINFSASPTEDTIKAISLNGKSYGIQLLGNSIDSVKGIKNIKAGDITNSLGESWGISVEDNNSTISFTGESSIESYSKSGSVYGIYFWSTTASVNGLKNIMVNSNSTNTVSQSNGIVAVKGDNIINFTGESSIIASSKNGKVYGIKVGGGTTTINGLKQITVSNNGTTDAYSIHMYGFGGTFNGVLNLSDSSGSSNQLVINGDIGNIGGTINLQLINSESKFTGIVDGDYRGITNLTLKNGAQWVNECQNTSFEYDRVTVLTGGTAANHSDAGIICQTDESADLTIDRLKGDVNVYYDGVTGNSLSIPGGYIAVTAADSGSDICLYIDDSDLLESTGDYRIALNNLANKLYYDSDNANLKGMAYITDGLSIGADIVAYGKITFDSYGQGWVLDKDAVIHLDSVKVNFTLNQVITNAMVEGMSAGEVSVYAFEKNYKADANLGTLTRLDKNTPREFTIDGQNHTLDGNNFKGITVNKGDILILEDIAEVKGFNKNVAVTNNGTVELAGTGVLSNSIGGSGTTEVVAGADWDSNVKLTQNTIVDENGTLTIAAGNIGKAITNNGILVLQQGTLGQNINGTGTVDLSGEVISSKNITNGVKVGDGDVLTVKGGKISGAVTVAKGGTVNANISCFTGNVVNNGLFNITGGTLTKGIQGSGKLGFEGNVTIKATEPIDSDILVAAKKTLTVTNSIINGYISVKDAGPLTLKVTGSSLNGDVDGTRISSGAVTGNNFTVSGSTFAGDITAAYSKECGSVTDKKGKVTINEIKNNKITITGSTSIEAVSVKAAKNDGVGNASGNMVSITGVAAVAAKKNAAAMPEQRVELSDVAAVWNGTGTAKSNTVTLDKVHVKEDVDGAVNFGEGEVSSNKITISNADIDGDIHAGWTFGIGNANSNVITLKNTTVNGIVEGASTHRGAVAGNTITVGNSVLGGDVTAAFAFECGSVTDSKGKVTVNEIKNNKVTITGSTTTKAISVDAAFNCGVGNASGNTVSITGIAAVAAKKNVAAVPEQRVELKDVHGVFNNSGTAKTNTVTLDKVNVAGDVYAAKNGLYGEVSSNKVTISNATIKGTVTGGVTAGTGNANSNTITLKNVIFENDIVGEKINVIVGGKTNKGAVTGNVVTISGSVLNGNITGGYTGECGSITDSKGKVTINEIKNNKVTITGSTSTKAVSVTAAENFGVGNASGNMVSITGIAAVAAKKGVEEVPEQRVNLGNVAAAMNGEGTAKSNSVTLDKVNVAGDVWGASTLDGEVSSNKVTISNAMVEGNITAGVSTGIGNANSNTITLKNVDVMGKLMVAVTKNGAVAGNTLTISNSTLSESIVVAGAETCGSVMDKKGKVTFNEIKNNKVTITGSTSTDCIDVVAATNTGIGNASGNTVSVTGIAAVAAKKNTVAVPEQRVKLNNVAGVLNGEGIAKSNTVTLDKVSISGNVLGARNTVEGEVSVNKVTISNGIVMGSIMAGLTEGEGNANSNVVTLKNVVSMGEVLGGQTNKGAVTGNVVTISGSVLNGAVVGGYSEDCGSTTDSKGKVIVNEIKNNKVTITGSWSAEPIMIVAAFNTGKGNASGNTVNVKGIATTASAEDQELKLQAVTGAANGNGYVKNNSVTLDAVNVSEFVYGASTDYGEASGNKVVISNAQIGGDIVGGITKTGNANKNTVTINGKLDKNGNTTVVIGDSKKPVVVCGGRTNYGDAGQNTVSISNATIYGDVFGGYTENGYATKNTVKLSGKVIVTGKIVGGASGSGEGYVYGNIINGKPVSVGWMSSDAYFSSTKMALNNVKSVSVGKLEGIDQVSVQSVQFNKGLTLLSAGSSDINLDIDVKDMSFEGGSDINIGDSMQIVNDKLQTNLQKQKLITNAGVAKKVTLNVAQSGLMQVSNVIVDPQTVTISESNAAAVAFINQGNDMIEHGLNQLANQGTGIQTFAGMQASDNKYTTKNNVEIDGKNTIVGVAKTLNNGLTYGIFYEIGNGDYDTYAEGYHGEGKQNYKGGGLIATKQYKNGNYIETSIRGGKLKNDLRTTDMTDHTGKEVPGYETDTKYYGVHIGMGRTKQISSHRNLDIYGKYFYTHTNSNNLTIDGDQFRLDSVNSHTIKLGAKLTHNLGNKYNLYYGAAYEYTFDGDIKGTVDGENMKQHSLGGGRAMIEIGSTMKASEKWSFDCNVKGYTGRREGMTYNLQAVYSF